jgi:WD40 repeat protein
VYALALNRAGSVVAAGTSEALIRLLDPRSGKKITKLRGHTVRAGRGWGLGTGGGGQLGGCRLRLAGYSCAACWLVLCCSQSYGKGVARVAGGARGARAPACPQDTVRCLQLNGDGTLLLSGASDGSIRLWDVGMQRCVQVRGQMRRTRPQARSLNRSAPA